MADEPARSVAVDDAATSDAATNYEATNYEAYTSISESCPAGHPVLPVTFSRT